MKAGDAHGDGEVYAKWTGGIEDSQPPQKVIDSTGFGKHPVYPRNRCGKARMRHSDVSRSSIPDRPQGPLSEPALTLGLHSAISFFIGEWKREDLPLIEEKSIGESNLTDAERLEKMRGPSLR